MSGKGVKGKNGLYWKPNPNGKLCGDVWEFSSERHNKKNKGKTVKLSHPTIKPYELIKRIIIASSNADSLVVDLFSGSGQTTLVSKELGIKSLGCEIDKKYYLEICKKICKN
jgi:site-specific DNA-methyltransferase (adenine-specific)